MVSSWIHLDLCLTRPVLFGGLCVSAVCASVLGVWEWTRYKQFSQHPSSEERIKKDLDEKNAKLQEELQKTNEKVDNVVHEMTILIHLRMIQENQRELFKLQQKNVEREMEDNKEKLQSVEKLITESEREKATDKTKGHLREKQKLLNAEWKLESRKEELEKLQLNTETLLKSEGSEGILTRMKERKKNLENYMEQLKEQLQITERYSDN